MRKDLQAELRNLEAVPAMTLFVVSTFVLFHFGLERDAVAGNLASGVLWVTLLLAAVLGMNRLFVTEREQGGFDALPAGPGRPHRDVRREGLGRSSASSSSSRSSAVPAFDVLLLDPGLGQALPGLLAVLALADLGLAVDRHARRRAGRADPGARPDRPAARRCPCSVPLLIAAAQATAPLLGAGGAEALPGRWLTMLALYDVVFGLLAYAVFDFLLED